MGGDATIGCDVLVIGSGAGGMTAALTARLLGLDVVIAEKDRWFGGTTALSGGWLWVPCSPQARRAGIGDSIDDARLYLQHELGPRFDARLVDAFLEAGPRMVEFLEERTALRFFLGTTYPDYHPAQPGGLPAGRSICAEPFDARALGDWMRVLRPPVSELTLFGLKVGSGPDFHHFFNARRSLRSALYVLRRIARHGRDVLLHGRDLLLMSGNALAGRLGSSVRGLGIPLLLESPALELIVEGGRVCGAWIEREGRRVRVDARRGVVCAAGGFSWDMPRRHALYPHHPEGATHLSLVTRGNTGDGLRMAQQAGAALRHASSPGSWMPMSRVPRRDGSFATYPHSYERGKPGVIAVNREARRFANESNSYHDFVEALLAARAQGDERPPVAYFICDSAFVRRYGLGIAKPFPLPRSHYLRSGYLRRADSLPGLARLLALDEERLAHTVREFNEGARRGVDPLFGRGDNVYNRYHGDAALGLPNPCLAPIEQAPFYAVEVLPGDLGTFTGLATDEHARVLREDGQPIAGLYAAGCDMASLFGGVYPGAGTNLGPAMTFGYLCARHLAGQVAEG
ncbi:FAD-dependent oxidoreductase [Pigmentiphaga sp.]|uniref:FAD-dependent oxidoreductase n=1 Tax=Pigmentiphaga sp. TaxID=1977564 RepID=UPI0025E1C44F|nr:FAD-dependent oxidoreductase [Pigmentiphaga sp.]